MGKQQSHLVQYLHILKLNTLHSLFTIFPKDSLPQILRTLHRPVLRCELINHLLECVERAKCLVSGEVVLRLCGAARDEEGSIVVSDSDEVFLFHGFSGCWGKVCEGSSGRG